MFRPDSSLYIRRRTRERPIRGRSRHNHDLNLLRRNARVRDRALRRLCRQRRGSLARRDMSGSNTRPFPDPGIICIKKFRQILIRHNLLRRIRANSNDSSCHFLV